AELLTKRTGIDTSCTSRVIALVVGSYSRIALCVMEAYEGQIDEDGL
ncbi:unnamed protein product, partial [marine sediment metagenome]